MISEYNDFMKRSLWQPETSTVLTKEMIIIPHEAVRSCHLLDKQFSHQVL